MARAVARFGRNVSSPGSNENARWRSYEGCGQKVKINPTVWVCFSYLGMSLYARHKRIEAENAVEHAAIWTENLPSSDSPSLVASPFASDLGEVHNCGRTKCGLLATWDKGQFFQTKKRSCSALIRKEIPCS